MAENKTPAPGANKDNLTTAGGNPGGVNGEAPAKATPCSPGPDSVLPSEK